MSLSFQISTLTNKLKTLILNYAEVIHLLTRSNGVKTSSLTKHTKRIRRFFSFCAMMFCINEDYTIPLHTLLTDIIDGQGGSAILIKVLNRLGVCASTDTLSHYIQHKNRNHTDAIHQYLSLIASLWSLQTISISCIAMLEFQKEVAAVHMQLQSKQFNPCHLSQNYLMMSLIVVKILSLT